MDIDKLQKINNLARELMRHGMAGSMDEAVRLAEAKIKGEPEVSSIKATIDGDALSQSKVEHTYEPSHPEPTPQNKAPAINMTELKENIDNQAAAINAINSKINEIINEFNKLHEEVNRLKTIQVPTPEEQGQDSQTQFRSQPEEKKEPHARTGGYNPDDVSVEKIFYSGTR